MNKFLIYFFEQPEMNTINERIRLLMSDLGYNNNSFAKALGVNPTVTFNITGGRENNPSYEFLQKLMFTFDNINPTWLLKGEGEMHIDGSKTPKKDKKSDDPVEGADKYKNFDHMMTIDILKDQLKISNEANKDLLIILKNFSAK